MNLFRTHNIITTKLSATKPCSYSMGHNAWLALQTSVNTGPLLTKKTPCRWYRDSRYKHKTVVIGIPIFERQCLVSEGLWIESWSLALKATGRKLIQVFTQLDMCSSFTSVGGGGVGCVGEKIMISIPLKRYDAMVECCDRMAKLLHLTGSVDLSFLRM